MPQLRIVDEDGLTLSKLALIDGDDLYTMIQAAEELNLHCLQFVELAGDTVFNAKQVNHIRSEIKALREHKDVKPELLDAIQKGAEEALKDVHIYLKFWGD